jgi:eukaryotic-like serine/threonine-protein kinase
MPMNSQVVLTITSGSLTGTQHIFNTPGVYPIGRESACHISFPDTEEYCNISRHHCDLQIMQLDPPILKIMDCNSTHGTFINGHKVITPTELLANQVLSIGNTSISVATGAVVVASKQTTLTLPSPGFRSGSKSDVLSKIKVKLLEVLSRFLEIYPADIEEKILVVPVESEPAKILQLPDYQRLALLGQGATSEVYLALHQESGKKVALKTLQPSIAKQADAVQKFIRETEYTKALDHPHIVKLLDFNYAPEALFYTTEYYDGGSLFGLMKQLGGKLPAVLAKSIILQILDGLDYIHQIEVPYIKLAGGGFGKACGLVHRSLKPENILLTTHQGQIVAKISDFALAQALNLTNINTQTIPEGSFAGTPHYMPRAQAVNFHAAQPAVDIWAAAACLYEMLTGYTPRDFDTQGALDPVSVIMEKPAIPIGDRVSYLPTCLMKVIDRALYEEPDHKTHFQTAIDFKTELLKAW